MLWYKRQRLTSLAILHCIGIILSLTRSSFNATIQAYSTIHGY